MSRVFTAHAVSVDGYITGRHPGPGHGLGDGSLLFDWYLEGTTPSQVFDGFRLSEPSARIFDALARRVGANDDPDIRRRPLHLGRAALDTTH